VRYFGGTLLGVGGLISAYKSAAAEVIAISEIFERFILFEYRIEFNEESINSVMRILKENGAKISSHTYDSNNLIIFQIKIVQHNTNKTVYFHLFFIYRYLLLLIPE
jgi:putative IMPACT (imprinted ancient) family translation regulator